MTPVIQPDSAGGKGKNLELRPMTKGKSEIGHQWNREGEQPSQIVSRIKKSWAESQQISAQDISHIQTIVENPKLIRLLHHIDPTRSKIKRENVFLERHEELLTLMQAGLRSSPSEQVQKKLEDLVLELEMIEHLHEKDIRVDIPGDMTEWTNKERGAAFFRLGSHCERSNPVQSEQWFQRASEMGHADASYKLGQRYQSSCSKKAELYFRRAAENGHAQAQMQMGRLEETNGNPVEAMKWYGTVLRQDRHPARKEAFLPFATLYEKLNQDQRKEVLESFLPQSPIEIFYQLGQFYDKKENYQLAAGWYNQGVKRGDADSYYRLAQILAKGNNFSLNFIKGKSIDVVSLLKHAAKLGHPEAAFELGVYLPEKSFEYLRLAAERGHAEAQYRIGIRYLIDDDIQNAFLWLQRSASQGNEKAKAELIKNLGQENEIGIETAIARIQSVLDQQDRLQSQIADLNEQIRDLSKPQTGTNSQNTAALDSLIKKVEEKAAKLASMRKELVELSKKYKAEDLEQMALSGKLAAAGFLLGLIYEHGLGVKADRARADQYYHLSTVHGYRGGFLKLGQQQLAIGKKSEALSHVQEGAKRGSDEAQVLLAHSFHARAQFLSEFLSEPDPNLLLSEQDFKDEEAKRLVQLKSGTLSNMLSAKEGQAVKKAALHEEQALEWLHRAAERGNLKALVDLAQYYEDKNKGQKIDVQDNRVALGFYEEAGRCGNGFSAWKAASIYEQGRDGIQPDAELAKQWNKRATELGYIPGKESREGFRIAPRLRDAM